MDDSKFPFDEKKPDAAGAGSTGADAGSVTSMFAAAAQPKAPATTEDLLAGLLQPKTVAPPAFPANDAVPPVSSSSSSSSSSAAAAAFAPSVASFEKLAPESKGAPGEVTRMLEQLQAVSGASHPPLKPTPVKPSGPPVASELKPGEFTQIFRQLPTPKPRVAQAAPPAAAPASAIAPKPPAPTSQAASPGEFTQFLQKMSGPGGGVAPANAVPSASDPVAASPAVPAAWPESFAVPEPPKAASAPGSFTQMFQTLSREGAPQVAPVAPPAPLTTPPTQASGPGAFTQMFQTLSPSQNPTPSVEPPIAAPLPPFSEQFGKPMSEPLREQPRSVPSNQGGFTQLFNSLSPAETPQQTPVARSPLETPFSLPGAPVSQPVQGGSGEFTRLMRSLSDPPQMNVPAPPMGSPMGPPLAAPAAQPMPSSMPSPSGPPSGPGEYTRIISGSAMREAGGGAPFPPMAPQAAQPAAQGKGGFAMPPIPMTPPHLAPPAMHPPAAHAPAPAGFGMPQPFAPPAPPAATPAPQGKLQQYLPLILVLNGALLLIVVIVLIFALRHH